MIEHIHHVSSPVLILITLTYYGIAWQFWRESKGTARNSKAFKSFTLLMLVFIFCASSGYLSDLLPEGEQKDNIREVLHWILFLTSAWFLLTNQVRHIERAMRDD